MSGDNTSSGALTMSMIGCLPDNVQQAIRSFSIRPGEQHITFCFPFMADAMRRYTTSTPEYHESHQRALSMGLLFDHSLDVISGYQSFVTLAPGRGRDSSPMILLFTLYQKDTTEGILRHFESFIKILLENNTSLSRWKMPIAVTDLAKYILDKVVATCTRAVMSSQAESISKLFQDMPINEIEQCIKEKIVLPSVRTYKQHFECHTKEVTSYLVPPEKERFLHLIEHLQTANCSSLQFQTADEYMKNSSTDTLVRIFWSLWSEDHLAIKIFPAANAHRSSELSNVGPFLYPIIPTSFPSTLSSSSASSSSCTTSSISSRLVAGLCHVPIKDGLQSIIRCLKAQHAPALGVQERSKRMNGCYCSVCQQTPLYDANLSVVSDTPRNGTSAVHRPSHPGFPFTIHPAAATTTTTPYSDALRAAATLPCHSPTPQRDTADKCHHECHLTDRISDAYSFPALPQGGASLMPYWLNILPSSSYNPSSEPHTLLSILHMPQLYPPLQYYKPKAVYR